MKKLLILSYTGLLLSACGNPPVAEQPQADSVSGNTVTLTDAQYRNAGIETDTLENRTVSSVLKLNGKIDVPPQNRVSISVPLGGYLKATELLPGTHVDKGARLAVMEDPQYIQLQQDYLTAKAQFAVSEREYKRQKDLNESKATSDKVAEQVEATYEAQRILIRALEQKLQLIGLQPDQLTADNLSRSISVHSSISGFVVAVNANIGKYVNPGDVLFELVNPTDIHLALTVFDKDLDKLAVGQRLLAYTNAHPDKKYACKIILISKSLSDDHSAEVHCHFEQYDETLLPGMFMNAEVELSGGLTTVLPEGAVVRFENKNYVFAVTDSRQFEMQEVHTGSSENGFTEITDADTLAGRQVVIRSAYDLLMTLKNAGDEE